MLTVRYMAGSEYTPGVRGAAGQWNYRMTVMDLLHLQMPDHLACSLDMATGTGKSYVLYGVAVILLGEGLVDRVLVLCPSNTIEAGLLAKFRDLAGNSDLRELLPANARVRAPRIINASETIDGSICAGKRHVKSSIRAP